MAASRTTCYFQNDILKAFDKFVALQLIICAINYNIIASLSRHIYPAPFSFGVLTFLERSAAPSGIFRAGVRLLSDSSSVHTCYGISSPRRSIALYLARRCTAPGHGLVVASTESHSRSHLQAAPPSTQENVPRDDRLPLYPFRNPHPSPTPLSASETVRLNDMKRTHILATGEEEVNAPSRKKSTF